MGKWDLKTFVCLCGCGKSWRALKDPLPGEQYAHYSHKPNAQMWVTLRGQYWDRTLVKIKHGKAETLDS